MHTAHALIPSPRLYLSMMKMEVSLFPVAVSILVVSLVTWAWRLVDWFWFMPKKLERCLLEQGLTPAKPYRIPFGDLKEDGLMIREARAKPLGFSHDLAPRIMPLIYQTIKNHGENSFIWIGPVPRVIIVKPEYVREVFTESDDFQKPTNINPMIRFILTGLVSYKGAKWAKHRKIINPAFHVEKLKLMAPVFYQCCNEMISKWEKLLSVEGSCELDVWPDLQTSTSDVISRAAFGSNYDEGKRIFHLLKEQANLIQKSLQSAYIPGWRFLPTKSNRMMKAIDKEIEASLENMINRREKAMKAGKTTKEDLLGILMESNFTEIQQAKNTKMGMSIKDVILECKLFFFAGQETTATLLAWTMILLSKFSDWQAKAREEVLQVFGDNVPDFDGLNRLKILTIILYEVLRLYPPVAATSRKVVKQTKLGNLLLPAGVQLVLPRLLIHQDREIWGDDALEFKPERFSGGIANATKNQVAFFPFGWGPRICIGQNFALTETKMALALVLRKFSFELSPSYNHSPSSILTLQPENGAQLILHKL